MNKIGKITSLIIVLVIVLMVLVLTNLDRGIKTAVETIGPELTGSEVTLSSVDLSLIDARGSFSGLRVGNPQGFAAADACTQFISWQHRWKVHTIPYLTSFTDI